MHHAARCEGRQRALMHPFRVSVARGADDHEMGLGVERPVGGHEICGCVEAELGCAAGEGAYQRLRAHPPP